jgi:hypothetical protein
MLVRQKFTLLVSLVGLTAMATLAAVFHHNVDELGGWLESLYTDSLLPLHEAQKMESALSHINYGVLEDLVGIKDEDAAVRRMQRRVTFQTGFNKFEKEFSIWKPIG